MRPTDLAALATGTAVGAQQTTELESALAAAAGAVAVYLLRWVLGIIRRRWPNLRLPE